MNKLFVVIPALNEEALISKTLDSLESQTTQDFSVIVVDNGSTDKTKELVTNYSKHSKFELFLIEENKKGVGYARNTGSLKAIEIGAKYIAGTDADTVLPPDWISSILNGFKKDGSELLCGESDPFKNIEFNSEKGSFALKARSLLFQKIKPYVRGYNYALTAEMFKKIGGIKQPLTKEGKPTIGEDTTIERDSLKAATKICPCLATVYPHPRRYIKNMLKFAEFNGHLHEGGIITEIRNESDLEKMMSKISPSAIAIVVDKMIANFFNEYLIEVYQERELSEKYWGNAMKFLAPFKRAEIEHDFSSDLGAELLWEKYQKAFLDNIKRIGKI